MTTKTYKTEKPNPRAKANIFSKLTFAYIFPLFIKGYQRDLTENDLAEAQRNHLSKHLGDKLEEAWRCQKISKSSPSLWKALGRVFWLEFTILGCALAFVEFVLKVAQPVALAQLITYFSNANSKVSQAHAYMYAGFIVATSFLNVLILHPYIMYLQFLGMKIRIACSTIVYRKILKVKKTAVVNMSTGQLTNLLSNDVNRFDTSVLFLHSLWAAPIVAVLMVVAMYFLVGLLSSVGILFLVLFVPLQMYLGKKTSVLRARTAARTDERMRLMNEIITGIQVIKMYVWEKPFAKLSEMLRRSEIAEVRKSSYIRGIIITSSFYNKIAIFLAILVYILTGNVPNAEYVFVVTAFYNNLRFLLNLQFPKGITEFAEVRISIKRLQKFLLYEELDSNPQPITPVLRLDNLNTETIGVNLKNASTSWSKDSGWSLQSVNIKAKGGECIAVIGPVGSGKSSILNVILSELPLESGYMKVSGKVSYASQEPWIFPGNVQQNILFGQPMDIERYKEVIKVCSLEKDLSILPHGDQTLVGERGVTLSGGQKARVNLARAVYSKADIYLLDDPLSAVDAHVAKQLFDVCIRTYLADKCTILVTHQVQHLQNVNRLYVVEAGKVVASGSYKDITESDCEFAKELKTADNNLEEDPSKVKERTTSVTYDFRKHEAQIAVKEHISSGKLSSGTYAAYFKASSSPMMGVYVILLLILTQITFSASDYFITYWVNLEQKAGGTQDLEPLSRDICLYIYCGIITVSLVVSLTRSIEFFRYCMRASIKLHNNMFSNVLQAPMQFFNDNPSGRILNRFSKDMGIIDEIIPVTAIDFMQIFLQVIGILVVVALVSPWMILVTAVIFIIFYLFRVVYMSSCRDLKRLDGTARSPIFTHINVSLQGLTTIRAFKAQNMLEEEFNACQNKHTSVWTLYLECTRAFGFYLDLICATYIGLVTFSFFLNQSERYGGNVGLGITQATGLTGLFQFGMRLWAELENYMTSVERVKEYTVIESEDQKVDKLPPETWPEQTNISFRSVSLQYSITEPLVLKELTFDIKSKEKVGVVGRTGAGKSSLIAALFQLANTQGEIVIDGVDITKISVHSFRSKISIIPQEPMLFSGTLRKNLDPFEQYPDDDLWGALEDVELKSAALKMSSGLDSLISEGGTNFSVGQRQLLCLARAIIRKNKILVLDEATANVDPQTDSLIQNTIRRKFSDCTVLTIAHRLNTIIDSDKVMVMDTGRLVEFDHPYVLLQNTDGMFYSMVQQTGPGMVQLLLKLSKDNFELTRANKV